MTSRIWASSDSGAAVVVDVVVVVVVDVVVLVVDVVVVVLVVDSASLSAASAAGATVFTGAAPSSPALHAVANRAVRTRTAANRIVFIAEEGSRGNAARTERLDPFLSRTLTQKDMK